MECNKAEDLFMKFMDNSLTKADAELLKKHIDVCGNCKLDFKIYDDILGGFSELEIFETPENFEEVVMKKVKECGIVYKSSEGVFANLFSTVIGACSVVIGILYLLILYRDSIMATMLNSPIFSQYAKAISPLTNLISEFANNFANTVSSIFATVTSIAIDYKFFILGIFVVLLGVQYILGRKRDKVEAE